MNNKERALRALKTEAKSVTSIGDVISLFNRFLSGADTDDRKSGLGRTSYVVTAKGNEVETAFKLVEAEHLIPSNTLDGRINPDYPQELQPRDRTRKSSVAQIAKMSGNLRPAQLADSGLSSHGAPIVGRDGVVESGNGRSMAIIKAYIEGKAEGYRQYLMENAGMYGFSREQVESMQSPVLVRERLTDVDRAKFARDSNLSDLQSMSAAETAWVDAERIDDRMMELFNPSESGNLLSIQNKPFIQAFLAEIGDQDTAGLLTADGRPTKQMIDRMQNAIFAKAYKNEKLVKLVAEEPDPDIRNILTALNNAASSFVQMQYLSGEAHKQTSGALVDAIEGYSELDKNDRDNLAAEALEALVSATSLVREAKDSGQDIEELLSQGALFGGHEPNTAALARFIAANNRSSKRLSYAFKALAKEINAELVRKGSAAGDLFGGFTIALVDVLTKVSNELEAEFGEGILPQGGLFESVSLNCNDTTLFLESIRGRMLSKYRSMLLS